MTFLLRSFYNLNGDLGSLGSAQGSFFDVFRIHLDVVTTLKLEGIQEVIIIFVRNQG